MSSIGRQNFLGIMITRNSIELNTPVETKPRSISFYVILAAALFAFIQTFSLLAPILLSFLLILLITLAVNPVISKMRGLTGGRKIATALIAAGFISVVVLTGMAFIGPVKSSFTSISERLPGYWERLQKPMIKMEKQAVIAEEKLQAEVTAEIAQTARVGGNTVAEPKITARVPPATGKDSKPLRNGMSQMLQGVAGSFSSIAINTAQILVVFVTVFFGVTFTLMNPLPIIGSIFSMVPERHHDQALIIMKRIGQFVPRWAAATLLGMLSIGLLVFMLMLPIFGFVDAMVLGLIAGMLEAVPFLGPILSAVPALLLAFGEGQMTPLWVILAYLAVQALENNIIIPLIMARSMKLHPVAVIFSMLLCVTAFGVLGVLVAAPMVAIVTIIHDEIYRKRYLPTVSDGEITQLARNALHEKQSATA